MIKKKLKLYYRVLVYLFFNYLYGKILIPKKNHKLFEKQDSSLLAIKDIIFIKLKMGEFLLIIMKT